MYNQPPTLPSINTVGNGIEYSSGNGDITRIKQEKEVLHSLPPIRAINDDDDDENNNNSNNNSRMSINQLCNDPDEEMKNAAAVLENMKQTALPPIEVSHLSNNSHEESIGSPNPDGLMSRLGEFTLVRKTMTAYEQGKNTLPLIKYTTEMVESSVSRISEKIPQLAQLDQYACRGLDKLGEIMDNNSYNYNNNNNSYNNSNDDSSNNNISALHVAMVDGDNSSYEDALVGGDIETRKRKVRGEPMRDSSPSFRTPPSRTHRTSQSNGSQNSPSYAHHNNTTVSSSTTSPAPSRWQQMLVGAGAAVGTARAVVSEESMKSLRYCLQWLQYATQHLEHQITVLHDLIAKLSIPPSSSDAMIHSNAPSALSAIKKKIVDNLRKVIDVVSRYASNCLPDQAKQNVRSFILSLPTRWATINHSDISTSASPLSSPQLNPVNPHPNNQTADYARRLLSLATESLDMLRRVGGIFRETVERAEAWVERLWSLPPVVWSSQQNGSTTNDYSYGQSSSTLHPSPGFRPRKSSNSSRMSNRKYTSRIVPDDDDESVTNNYDSDDSDDSEVENKRMEDSRSHRSLKNSNSIKSPPSHGGLNSGKKRKKIAKKDDSMDITETY